LLVLNLKALDHPPKEGYHQKTAKRNEPQNDLLYGRISD
jgi:hypothetical protein